MVSAKPPISTQEENNKKSGSTQSIVDELKGGSDGIDKRVDELGLAMSSIGEDDESFTDTIILSELHGEVQNIFKFLNDRMKQYEIQQIPVELRFDELCRNIVQYIIQNQGGGKAAVDILEQFKDDNLNLLKEADLSQEYETSILQLLISISACMREQGQIKIRQLSKLEMSEIDLKTQEFDKKIKINPRKQSQVSHSYII